MSTGSPVSNKTSPSTSPQPPLSSSAQSDIEGHEDPKPTPAAFSFSLPCWATQALCDLARCETDLRRLREQQVTEAQMVGRGVERALLGAQREEGRLLERVEQDHRDLQLRLEQVQRDNGAAIRVGQRLVDQRLYKVIKLRELIKICGGGGGDGNKDREGDLKRDQLLKGVAELVLPWEVSLALKRVSFKPSAQPNTHASCSSRVSRSLSMSVIDNSSQKRLNHFTSGRQNSLNENRLRGERSEPALLELEEDAESLGPEEVRLIRQFGKQGSGRADLTLPSGVHATPQGQLFLVDCGNARVQVTDAHGNVLQHVTSPTNDLGGSSRRCRNYFDVAVNAKGLIALSCAAERALLILSRHGRLLQTFGGGPYIAGVPRDELEAPRGVTVTQRDEFLVADIRKGTLTALKLEPKTGSRLERTVVTGFHRPYLVSACLHTGLVAVSERGSEMGQEPCVKILGPGWDTLRILGVCSSLGPVLSCPWGLCIDKNGSVLVADWGEKHRVLIYPSEGAGRVILSDGLSSPRGLALLPNDLLVVSDSMHHCVKIYQNCSSVNSRMK
uniref:E3 ubiquitin-protein ligase TRIM32 n=1 Tax=Sinocyclocheilus rhinocerous TaxID=307959 RepID=A0A673MRN2_9TELE